MKSFGPKAGVLPQPVLIIGPYGKDGRANAMNAAWAANVVAGCREVGLQLK